MPVYTVPANGAQLRVISAKRKLYFIGKHFSFLRVSPFHKYRNIIFENPRILRNFSRKFISFKTVRLYDTQSKSFFQQVFQSAENFLKMKKWDKCTSNLSCKDNCMPPVKNRINLQNYACFGDTEYWQNSAKMLILLLILSVIRRMLSVRFYD